MTWRSEKTRTGTDMVWEGVENGIAPSPTQGTANLQNVNISTSTGEVMASYARTSQSHTAITDGTLTPDGATNFTGPSTLQVGQWINVSASSVTSISTTTTPTTAAIDYLVVGGGGGGGNAHTTANDTAGGGGGAGEVGTGSSTVSVGSYTITVGAGGEGATAGATPGYGNDGSSSVLTGIKTSVGGGGGGSGDGSNYNGRSGASGGGGGSDQGGGNAGTGGTATAGYAGGNATSTGVAGGGGGAGAVGSAGSGAFGGDGGDGVQSSITGTATYYGGGGGGGSSDGSGGSGGDGGGGTGADGTGSAAVGGDATANTGGGGGGGARDSAYGAAGGGDGGSGIIIIAYTTGSCIAVGGTISFTATKTVHTFTTSGTFRVLSIVKTNQYYISYKSGTTYKLSAKFDSTGANALTHGTTGSITFSTVAIPAAGIAKATEEYTTASAVEYRYYVLDSSGYVWVYDTAIYDAYGTKWMLPNPTDNSTFRFSGMGVINGMLIMLGKAYIFGKPTTDLGREYWWMDGMYMNDIFPTNNKTAIVGFQGKMYYCDGNYIGEIFPTTSLVTSIANIQSVCSYTASSTTGTINAIISGSLPYSGGTRIPAVFYTDVYGTLPTSLTPGIVYYIGYDPETQTFKVYTAITGGSSKDLSTGAVGNQYFSTFWPFGSDSGVNGSSPLIQFQSQRVNLPTYETSQCLVEVGNTILIGCNGTTVYPWNQIDATPSDGIELPEANVKTMINVNNMAYIFAGNKGNIYISNNAVASLALKVPDYCAGVPGTPLTYIEPYFTWGDAAYVRGRVYFSILDQTSTKAGNCGGMWSFIPSQNIDPNQSVGMALRLENQNSYGDYDGYATIIIPNEEQIGNAPLYWSFWQDSYSTGTSSFGMDYTGTVPVTTYVVETDLAPTGTFLEKQTYAQLEYKLTTPLASGDSVQLYYRLNSTDAWTTCGTVKQETTNKIAGYFDQKFQKTQWVQFRAVVTTAGTTSSSFVRLAQIRLR